MVPYRAAKLGTEGVAVVSFIVGCDGSTTDLAVEAESPVGLGLGKELLAAVARTRWMPATRDGERIAVLHRVRHRFVPVDAP